MALAGLGDAIVWVLLPTVLGAIAGYQAQQGSLVGMFIAMAGNTVSISPVGMMMIHNPATISIGDEQEMKRAIDRLSEIKESIINAYELKTGLPRKQLSNLMNAESWFNAKKAKELGFVDSILYGDKEDEDKAEGMIFSSVAVTNSLLDKLRPEKEDTRVDAGQLQKRLSFLM